MCAQNRTGSKLDKKAQVVHSATTLFPLIPTRSAVSLLAIQTNTNDEDTIKSAK